MKIENVCVCVWENVFYISIMYRIEVIIKLLCEPTKIFLGINCWYDIDSCYNYKINTVQEESKK